MRKLILGAIAVVEVAEWIAVRAVGAGEVDLQS